MSEFFSRLPPEGQKKNTNVNKVLGTHPWDFLPLFFLQKDLTWPPESYPKCVSNTESNFPRYSNSKLIPHTCWIWKFHFLSSLGVYSILLHVDRYRNEIHKSRILNIANIGILNIGISQKVCIYLLPILFVFTAFLLNWSNPVKKHFSQKFAFFWKSALLH